MAAIGKIREQSTLLLIVIGGAMVAFVLGDIFSNRGSSPADQYVGEVYGEEINMLDYEKRVEAQKQSLASIGQPVSSAAEQQIRNQVWNNMVQERIMYNEMNKLGMRLGQDEFDDVRFGESVRPEFANDQNFQNPETGEFDPKLVQNYFSFLKERYPLFYENQVNRIVNERLYQKYNNLVKGGIFVNTLEAKDEYYRQDQKVSFNFVVQEYTSIPDSTVEVSEQDLRTYFNDHKDEDRFERDAMVDIKFVVFEVEPTAEDMAEIRADLEELVGDFRATKNDSLFVLKYADTKNGAAQQLVATMSEDLPDMLEGAEVGEVVGPYKTGERFAIAKIATSEPKEEATSRHILLSKDTEPDVDILLARADSIKRVILREDNFEEMVTRFSEDPGSVGKGGKYEWFDRQRMVPEFTEASFDRPIGSINVIETDYGVHIVEPLDRREGRAYTAYVVDAAIEPSNNTFNEIYDIANDFSITAENIEGMETLANERGYELKEGNDITAQSRNIPGVGGSAEAVRWAHNKEKSDLGDLSQPFEFDRKIVVVGLVDRSEAGRATFEMAKEEIKPEVILEKKKERFASEMSGKSLEELKSEFNLEIKTASNVSEKRPTLPGGASEPYVVGYALSMAEGALSEPLEGNRGVYVVQQKSKNEIAPRDEYATYQDELMENRENSMKTYTSGVYRALKDFADVKDERATAF
jgi:parvulin-like peptidyl-prolyl isomerase